MAYPIGLAADRIGASEVFMTMGITILGILALVALIQRRFIFGVTPTPKMNPAAP